MTRGQIFTIGLFFLILILVLFPDYIVDEKNHEYYTQKFPLIVFIVIFGAVLFSLNIFIAKLYKKKIKNIYVEKKKKK
ncbi:MAG: hypothetical protein ACQESP_02840 [Candidatus Muiribacteriota bacterium]